jgi:peptidyl-prolyl cis-trans isomerase B (cyclophilin B)
MRLPRAIPASLSRRALTSALLALSTSPLKWPAFADDTSVPGSIDLSKASPAVTSRCFLDISTAGSPIGRIVIDLYGEVAPRTTENFRALCTGEKGFGYTGSSFYRILSKLTVQGGNVAPADTSEGGDRTTQGRSIYGPTFPHENYAIAHTVEGLVSMVNSGVGGAAKESDSRFLIQLVDDAGYMDGRYPAFGRVTQGMDVVRTIEQQPVKGSKNAPVQRITIDAAGELSL